MGRGRQKAKQTKVARELKYYTPPTDIRALEQELARSGRTDVAVENRPSHDEDEDLGTPWSDKH